MGRLLIIAAMTVLLSACSQRGSGEQASRSTGEAGFVDRVWTVVDSPGGSGGLYVFLSDGTFVKAAKEARPAIGKWSWDGDRLTVVESALPYTADIDSLTDSSLELTIHFMERNYSVSLIPATASMPDTTRAVEFDPVQASIIAAGNKPAWLFTIENDRATLRMNHATVLFANGEWVQDCASVWDYTAYRTSGAGREEIRMQLSTETCVDSTSGAESPLTAVLIRGGRNWYGCAVAGKR